MRKMVRGAATVLVAAALVLSAAGTLHAQGTVPTGTAIVINLDQTVSSKDAKVGETVTGDVANAVIIDGKVLIPKGSQATMHVSRVLASGRLTTPAELYLKLNTIHVRGSSYRVSTSSVGSKAGSHAKRNTVAIGGGTVAGALIGGLAGGGKGAAIGAGVGAGAGTGGAALTGKKDITYSAEQKLTFRLTSSVSIH